MQNHVVGADRTAEEVLLKAALTPALVEALRLYASPEGLTRQQMAARLGIDPRSMKERAERLRERLGQALDRELDDRKLRAFACAAADRP